MIEGYFDGNTPIVELIVGAGSIAHIHPVLLDTGFTGDLQITTELARELNISVDSVEKMKVADGRIVDVPSSFAFVEMEGVKKYIQVLIAENMSLAGISLLSRFQYKAIIDCKYKTVALEKA